MRSMFFSTVWRTDAVWNYVEMRFKKFSNFLFSSFLKTTWPNLTTNSQNTCTCKEKRKKIASKYTDIFDILILIKSSLQLSIAYYPFKTVFLCKDKMNNLNLHCRFKNIGWSSAFDKTWVYSQLQFYQVKSPIKQESSTNSSIQAVKQDYLLPKQRNINKCGY